MDRLGERAGAPILALDVPSGLDAGTGVAHAPTIRATATATFIALKPGLLTLDGPDHCGELSVHALDIGDDASRAPACASSGGRCSATCRAILARRMRKSHKGTFGRACVIGGAEGLVGAALLAGRAALRLGAGRVVVGLAGAQSAARRLELARTDAARGRQRRRRATTRGSSGPGLGGGERALAIVDKAVRCAQPIVLDADALNPIAANPALRERIARARSAPTLATPHPAEAARLLGCRYAARFRPTACAPRRRSPRNCARMSC